VHANLNVQEYESSGVLAIPSCVHTTDQPKDARMDGANDGS
jgi:hypothetical protein